MLTYISLFSGIGCNDIAVQHLLGWKPYCYVENDTAKQRILSERIGDGSLFNAPVWDDAANFDGTPWQGITDCIIGSDERQDGPVRPTGEGECAPSLADHFIRIVEQVRPKYVIRETPSKIKASSPASADSFCDWLEALDYRTTLFEVRASDLGASHRRTRLYVCASMADTGGQRRSRPRQRWADTPCRPIRWSAAPRIHRETDGAPYWDERIRSLGVGAPPPVVAVISAISTEQGDILSGAEYEPNDSIGAEQTA